jgi:CubicO group peptidase (beta-lactamase class C family)
MSKKLFLLLAIVMVLSALVACGKEQVEVTRVVEKTVVETVLEKHTAVETVIETIVVAAPPQEVAAAPPYTPPDWPTWQWPTSSPEEQGMNPGLLSAMLDHIEQTGAHIHSIVVVRNGYMVLDEHFFYENAPYCAWRSRAYNAPHPVCSCTKNVISILIGIAIDQGYIQSVDQPLLSFFPGRTVEELTDNKRALTLEHLLTMSAGFRCGDANDAVLERMIESGDQIQYMLDRPVPYKPGTFFEYCNGVSHLLSAVIQNATGMSTSVFAYENLFRPLGITNLTWGADYNGVTLGYTDIFMTPHDMAKIGQLYLDQGRWNGEQIVSAEWVAESTREHVYAGRGELAEGYGYKWWVDSQGYYLAAGNAAQYIFVVPQHNLVVVFNSLLFDDDFLIPKRLLEEYIIPAVE